MVYRTNSDSTRELEVDSFNYRSKISFNFIRWSAIRIDEDKGPFNRSSCVGKFQRAQENH